MTASTLKGMPLRYLIGTDNPGDGFDSMVTECGYDVTRPVRHGPSIGYCNLFDEKGTGKYGPYLVPGETARHYREGQINPNGPGWRRNLGEQFTRRRIQGFRYVELDNPDAYAISDVLGAVEVARDYGLSVVAKNPLLMETHAQEYLSHPNIVGAIVENDAGTVHQMVDLRSKAGRPDLPIWFVFFGGARHIADGAALIAGQFQNVWVSYSQIGEYEASTQLVKRK